MLPGAKLADLSHPGCDISIAALRRGLPESPRDEWRKMWKTFLVKSAVFCYRVFFSWSQFSDTGFVFHCFIYQMYTVFVPIGVDTEEFS